MPRDHDFHPLLEGVPGLAKTLAIKSLARCVDVGFSRIQFTPDLLPADLVGTMIYNQQRQEFTVKKGPLFSNFILADEIVSGLDVSSQAQVLQLLERLVAELGLALAFISHDLSVIRRLCSRVLVLYQGRIVENRETAALFASPEADYTRELLDAIPLPDPDQPWV